jgi:hypothetical protein
MESSGLELQTGLIVDIIYSRGDRFVSVALNEYTPTIPLSTPFPAIPSGFMNFLLSQIDVQR